MKEHVEISKPKKHRNKIGMVPSTQQPYICLARVKMKHKEAIIVM